jgi:hypothetical protein
MVGLQACSAPLYKNSVKVFQTFYGQSIIGLSDSRVRNIFYEDFVFKQPKQPFFTNKDI